MFLLSISTHVVSRSLWQEARFVCDSALAEGLAYVLILHGAELLADESVLTEQDHGRASRFRHVIDCRNFTLGRTAVHQLVRPANATKPYAFLLGDHGKPFLSNCAAFNLSHSEDWVACTVGPNPLLGIDVETFGRLQDYRAVLSSVVHPAEQRCIEQAEPDQRWALFRRCWTRKEAVLKATGKGLSDDLRSIDVRLNEREPVLRCPAPLRLIDLAVNHELTTVSLALDASVPGAVVMIAS